MTADLRPGFRFPCLTEGCKCCTFVPIQAEPSRCEGCEHLFTEHDKLAGSVAKRIYKETFGFDEVRPYHEQAVSLAVAGHSIVLILPTGNGKSYCCWAPVLLTEGLAIIIEPLLSLISDQLTRLNKKYLKKHGYEAVAITGEGQKTPGKYDIQQADLFARLSNPGSSPTIKFIYMTAEKLSNWISARKLDKLMQLTKVNRIIFDEAFVLNQWSDFRPEHYQTLKSITTAFPDIPYTLATACMMPESLQSLKKNLNLAPVVIMGDLSRPNLFINVRRRQYEKNSGKDEISRSDSRYIVSLMKKYKDDFGVIYCNSKNQCDRLHNMLVDIGVKSIDKYYGTSNTYSKARRTTAENTAAMEKWNTGEVKCMIATTAFGMGIDKPNVRYVVHWTMPDSAISYYQQIGRAGRDGKPSECVLYYQYAQKATIQKIKKGSGNSDREVLTILGYCRNNFVCRHVQLGNLLGQPKQQPCLRMCDVCLRPGGVPQLEYEDYSDYAKRISSLVWNINQTDATITSARLAEMLRRTKPDHVGLPAHVIPQFEKIRRKYLDLGRYHQELLIEMVLRGYLRDQVSDNHGNIVAHLKVDDPPTPDRIYEFSVPKPLPEVFVELPVPQINRGLKRKREFMDIFSDEPKERAVAEVSSDEEFFTKEEWKVTKFIDRHTDYAEPYLQVKWQTGEVTWEPEQEIRKNCSKLYWQFRAPLEKSGEWVSEPKIFNHDFYS